MENFLTSAGICIIACIVAYAILSGPTPVVLKSASTHRCIKVIIGAKEVPCDQMPEIYETIWVK